MHNNPNTDHENLPLDSEDWEIALEPCFSHPEAALQFSAAFRGNTLVS